MYHAFGINKFQNSWVGVGGHGEKNSSEGSKIFFQLLANNCQKHEILTMEQNYDSLRYVRSPSVAYHFSTVCYLDMRIES